MRTVWQPSRDGLKWEHYQPLWQPSRDGLKWEQYDSLVGMDWNEDSMAWQPSRDGLKWGQYDVTIWQLGKVGSGINRAAKGQFVDLKILQPESNRDETIGFFRSVSFSSRTNVFRKDSKTKYMPPVVHKYSLLITDIQYVNNLLNFF